MLGYLSADIISEKRTVFLERSSRKTVSFENQNNVQEQISAHISPQMEVIVFTILQIFFATFAVLKIGEYSRTFPSFSWRIFGHVTSLDQLCTSRNVWWIMVGDNVLFENLYLLGVNNLRSWWYGVCKIKFWRQSRLKRVAKPRGIPPARELGYFECRPLLSPHWPQLIPIKSTN